MLVDGLLVIVVRVPVLAISYGTNLFSQGATLFCGNRWHVTLSQTLERVLIFTQIEFETAQYDGSAAVMASDLD